ncbi:16S rRNA (cytidine(1402)-2'-O)-methyltransferase [Methylocaldum marinum]|uniref:16S rRNA (cytidine(1402)-2'-O)-methyltransferase n=1 Tax=Methylocaldum marinum TaxID=1432792 RepID=UPI001E5A99C9|nr:16S rRNA (cytidine(1402)-2'-O)-methyltransferase [Methylocaldum marinum]
MTQTEPGILYLVATPIGNLRDFTFRAVDVLQQVDLIACEDTRHSRPLLDHYGISTSAVPFHEHNEDSASPRLVDRLLRGESIALISDAGTPLISDPGFPLVRSARSAGIRVVPVPGACALVAALSASGLPTDRFAFEGFLPRRPAARKASLENLSNDARTLIFYESSHRVLESVADIAAIFPSERRLVIARELTKLFETIVDTKVGEAISFLESDPNMLKGEFVLVLEGAPEFGRAEGLAAEEERILRILLEDCSVKTAVALTVKITGARRETVYRTALRLNQERVRSDD